MDKNYITYTTEQLLNDDFFIQSELHPTEESRTFWSNLQEKMLLCPQKSKMPASSYMPLI